MKLILALSISLAVCSCKPKQEAFPTTITVTKSDKLTRVKGTKLFVEAPAVYKPLEKVMRLQKNDYTYFQVIEVPGSNFNENKTRLSRAAIESQGATVDVYQKVSFNGFEGVYCEGPSKLPGETKLMLMFGDSSFSTMMAGVCRTVDKTGLQELRSIFRHAYYDTSYKLNPLELLTFTFNDTISGFGYAGRMGNMYIYTPNGLLGNDDAEPGSSFQLMPLQAGSLEKVKELMEMTSSKLKVNDFTTKDVQKKETMINGYPAFEIHITGELNHGIAAHLYEVGIFKAKDSTGCLFMAYDGADGLFMDRFVATAHSIKL